MKPREITFWVLKGLFGICTPLKVPVLSLLVCSSPALSLSLPLCTPTPKIYSTSFLPSPQCSLSLSSVISVPLLSPSTSQFRKGMSAPVRQNSEAVISASSPGRISSLHLQCPDIPQWQIYILPPPLTWKHFWFPIKLSLMALWIVQLICLDHYKFQVHLPPNCTARFALKVMRGLVQTLQVVLPVPGTICLDGCSSCLWSLSILCFKASSNHFYSQQLVVSAPVREVPTYPITFECDLET